MENEFRLLGLEAIVKEASLRSNALEKIEKCTASAVAVPSCRRTACLVHRDRPANTLVSRQHPMGVQTADVIIVSAGLILLPLRRAKETTAMLCGYLGVAQRPLSDKP